MWRHDYDQVVGHRRFAFVDPTPVYLAEAAPRTRYTTGDESGGTPRSRAHRFCASVVPAATLFRVGPVIDPTSHVYRTSAERPHSSRHGRRLGRTCTA